MTARAAMNVAYHHLVKGLPADARHDLDEAFLPDRVHAQRAREARLEYARAVIGSG